VVGSWRWRCGSNSATAASQVLLQVVRHSGLDITIDAFDQRRAAAHLYRQGPDALRWALFEAAGNPSRRGSPDVAY
jgi:hypothetical protein